MGSDFKIADTWLLTIKDIQSSECIKDSAELRVRSAVREILMKKMYPLVLTFVLMLSAGCGGTAKPTELAPIPPAKVKGPLSIALTPAEDMAKEDLAFIKNTLREEFEGAGYDPVSLGKKRGNSGTAIDITVEKFEFTQKNESGCVAVSGVCTSICPCVAPVLLFPRYFDVRADLITKVAAYRSGRLLFSDRFAEEGESPANVVDAGTEPMKNSLKKTAINNTVAKIMGELNRQ